MAVLQYSCLENPMGRGAWQATVHGVAKSQIQLSDLTFTFHFHALEKEMATHSSVLAWRTPGTVEPGGLRSVGSHRVHTTEVTQQQQLHYLHVNIRSSQQCLLKRHLLSSIEWSQHPCQKSINHKCLGLFLASQFIFNICLTLDLPVPHCFDYYSCVVSFEIGMCVSPISFLKLF